ncbi:MAG: 2-dehydro-3-deoxyphosphooctonate aldolase [Proteobacteria bacterium]|nr:2-dehydro-3-deoxyphosphooctonate aldolase [Pseudomonadota bacterium]
MRLLALTFLLTLLSAVAYAEDVKVASVEKPKDPGLLYNFIHGFAPETAVDMWRGGSRPALSTLLKQRGFELGQPVYIRIFKYEGVVEVWMKRNEQFDLFEVYPICVNSGKLGPKLKQGDRQAPEGFYEINAKHLNPNSKYHLAINMGYPNAYDREHGRTGDFLMIHGACASIGCYALTNANIEEVYSLVKAALDKGQENISVHAFPFRMTREALAERQESKWINFWVSELMPAYETFDVTRLPPRFMTCGGVYHMMDGIADEDIPEGCEPITAWE